MGKEGKKRMYKVKTKKGEGREEDENIEEGKKGRERVRGWDDEVEEE